MEWLNEYTVVQAGGVVLGLFALGVLIYITRTHKEQTKQFTKILGNHLHDAHMDKIEEIKSRDKHTEILTKQESLISRQSELIKDLCEEFKNLRRG